MKKRYVFLFLIFLSTQSCWVDPCNPDCGDYYGLSFRIVNKSSGRDLVFGPNKIYDRLQIKIFSVKGRDTTFTDVRVLHGTQPSDSILFFSLPVRTDTAYLQLNAIDNDTLSLTYGLSTGRCCTFTSIKAVNYNGDLIQTKDSTIELKK